MKYSYVMTSRESYWNQVPKGMTIQCVSDDGPNMGGPARKDICRVLNMMGINVKENEACCHYSFWNCKWQH